MKKSFIPPQYQPNLVKYYNNLRTHNRMTKVGIINTSLEN